MMRSLLIIFLLALCGCTTTHVHTAFLTPVCIKPYKDYTYYTCSPINFVIEEEVFTIPKGFETDLSSIPKIAWPILSPFHSSSIRPALVHNWFYRMTCDFDRQQSDLIFYHMLLNEGIGPLRASLKIGRAHV